MSEAEFRRLFLQKLRAAHHAGRLRFFTQLAHLAERNAFAGYLAPWHDAGWAVYAKRPVAGPEAVLAYLSRYTHRVAITNSRLIALDEAGVTFKWKNYRASKANGGRDRRKTMALDAHEFIRRFLLHVLPSGFHRIRLYRDFANVARAGVLARARELLHVPAPHGEPELDREVDDRGETLKQPCASCGARIIIIETCERGSAPRTHPPRPMGIDSKVQMTGEVRLDEETLGLARFRTRPTHQNQAIGRLWRENHYSGGAIRV